MPEEKEEIWKVIKGYEGRYQVSNKGRVKSLERTSIDKIGRKRHIKELIMKPTTDHNGYLRVNLYDSSGKKRLLLVHRLVCEAFHENPKNKPCVNHIDENKTNNAVSNLEWCTYKENNNHGTHNVRVGKAVSKALSKPVGQYTRDGEFVRVWESMVEVERRLGFGNSHIGQVARGERKTAYGFIWKYIEEEK